MWSAIPAGVLKAWEQRSHIQEVFGPYVRALRIWMSGRSCAALCRLLGSTPILLAWWVLSGAADRFPENTPVSFRVSLGLFATGVGLLHVELVIERLWIGVVCATLGRRTVAAGVVVSPTLGCHALGGTLADTCVDFLIVTPRSGHTSDVRSTTV